MTSKARLFYPDKLNTGIDTLIQTKGETGLIILFSSLFDFLPFIGPFIGASIQYTNLLKNITGDTAKLSNLIFELCSEYAVVLLKDKVYEKDKTKRQDLEKLKELNTSKDNFINYATERKTQLLEALVPNFVNRL